MKLYHYTTLDSLLKILASKKLRFTSLEYVDDSYEHQVSSDENYTKMGRYCYVSSWTKKREDYFQWNLYGDKMNGVMIELNLDGISNIDKNFTELFVMLKDKNIPQGLDKLKSQMLQTEGNFILGEVIYDDDKLQPLDIKIEENGMDGLPNTSIQGTEEIGKYKRKSWDFQEETRFRFMTVPWTKKDFDDIKGFVNKCTEDNRVIIHHKLNLDLLKRLTNDFELKQLPYIDLSLSDEFFKRITIFLGPKLSKNSLNKRIAEESIKALYPIVKDKKYIYDSNVKLF